MTEEKQAQDAVEAEPEKVLSKKDLQAELLRDRETRVVDGARLRGLSPAQRAAIQGIKLHAISGLKGQEAEQEFQVVDMITHLAYGVIEPDMTMEEWRAMLDTGQTARLTNWIATIKAMTGLGGFDVEAVKNG